MRQTIRCATLVGALFLYQANAVLAFTDPSIKYQDIGYRSHELKRLGSLTDGQPDEVFFVSGDRENIDFGDTGLGGPAPVKWNNRGLVWNILAGEISINPLANDD